MNTQRSVADEMEALALMPVAGLSGVSEASGWLVEGKEGAFPPFLAFGDDDEEDDAEDEEDNFDDMEDDFDDDFEDEDDDFEDEDDDFEDEDDDYDYDDDVEYDDDFEE